LFPVNELNNYRSLLVVLLASDVKNIDNQAELRYSLLVESSAVLTSPDGLIQEFPACQASILAELPLAVRSNG
jgi:hypothetical protein